MGPRTPYLGELRTPEVSALLKGPRPVVILLPVGSVEPHGPHLPLCTDTSISESAAKRALPLLDEAGVCGLIAPSIPYGVTDFAEGFAGAISVSAEALTPFVASVVEGFVSQGFSAVCLVNNHLEPPHDSALKQAARSNPLCAYASPLLRRWGRLLSDEYRSGACHAGRYETSLILADNAELVDIPSAESLPPVDISLSVAIQSGQDTFRAAGMDLAYTGAPSEASAREGEEQLAILARMVATEVIELLETGDPAASR